MLNIYNFTVKYLDLTVIFLVYCALGRAESSVQFCLKYPIIFGLLNSLIL